MRSGMICLLLSVGMLLGGCAEAEPLHSGHHDPVRLTTWQTYWDMGGAVTTMLHSAKSRMLFPASPFATTNTMLSMCRSRFMRW